MKRDSAQRAHVAARLVINDLPELSLRWGSRCFQPLKVPDEQVPSPEP